MCAQARGQSWVVFLGMQSTSFERGTFTGPELISEPDWQAKARDSPVSAPLALGYKPVPPRRPFFTQVLRSKLRFLCLQDKHFTNLAPPTTSSFSAFNVVSLLSTFDILTKSQGDFSLAMPIWDSKHPSVFNVHLFF